MDSSILKTLSGATTGKLNNEKDLNSSDPQSFIATFSGITDVYNLFPGRVAYLGYYNNSGSVYVQVSNHELVRYLNLDTIEIYKGNYLVTGEKIGSVKAKRHLQFEYCTQWKGESIYPVRYNNKLYFKQNPIDLLNGLYVPQEEITIASGITRPNDTVEFTDDQSLEWRSMFDIE